MQLQTAVNLTSCAYINREFVDRSLNCNVHHVVIRSIDPALLCRAVYRMVFERQRLATNGELNELTCIRRISTDRKLCHSYALHLLVNLKSLVSLSVFSQLVTARCTVIITIYIINSCRWCWRWRTPIKEVNRIATGLSATHYCKH